MAPGIPGGGLVQELFTMNLDGSALTQITHDGLSKFLPHFSPDGRRLLYTKFLVGQYNDPDAQTDVVVYDFATKAETQLTHTGHSFQPVWSPDGRRIAFGSFNGEALWIMNADGSDVRLVGAPTGARFRQAVERLRLVERRLDPLHRRAVHRRLLQGAHGQDPS